MLSEADGRAAAVAAAIGPARSAAIFGRLASVDLGASVGRRLRPRLAVATPAGTSAGSWFAGAP